MRTSSNKKNKTSSETYLRINIHIINIIFMYESSGSRFFGTNSGIQSRL